MKKDKRWRSRGRPSFQREDSNRVYQRQDNSRNSTREICKQRYRRLMENESYENRWRSEVSQRREPVELWFNATDVVRGEEMVSCLSGAV